MFEWSARAGTRFAEYVLGDEFIYAPLFLISSALIAAVYWYFARPGGSLLSYLLPREIYAHRSSKADWSIGFANILFVGLGGASFIVLSPFIAGATLMLVTDPTGLEQQGELSWGWAVLLVALLVLAEDFCRYLNHLLHHKLPVLWPFHAVHHSAQVLTPITFFRAHPMYYLLQRCLISASVGLCQGLVVGLAFGRMPAWIFFAATFAHRGYYLLGVHLRHSHIPVGYGRYLERILVSPRMHQVHHSVERRHYDRNFGEIFALWDWMFGTLYLPEKGERFEFGLLDENGERYQPHPDLASAMLVPFGESAKALRGIASRTDEAELRPTEDRA